MLQHLPAACHASLLIVRRLNTGLTHSERDTRGEAANDSRRTTDSILKLDPSGRLKREVATRLRQRSLAQKNEPRHRSGPLTRRACRALEGARQMIARGAHETEVHTRPKGNILAEARMQERERRKRREERGENTTEYREREGDEVKRERAK